MARLAITHTPDVRLTYGKCNVTGDYTLNSVRIVELAITEDVEQSSGKDRISKKVESDKDGDSTMEVELPLTRPIYLDKPRLFL